MFKEKASKKRLVTTNNAKDHSTLDVMHNKMIKTFALKSKEKITDNALLDKMINSHYRLKEQLINYPVTFIMSPSIITIYGLRI